MKKTKVIIERYNHRIDEILEVKGASSEALNDIKDYLEIITSLSDTASKKTHYDNLNEWSTKAYDFIHLSLKKYGFANGQPEVNKKNPNALLWWNIYGMLSSITYSPNIRTEVSLHHSSAFERNEAMRMDLELLIKKLGI